MSEMEISAIVAGGLVVIGLIVKATPTKKDDRWFRKFKQMIGRGGVILIFALSMSAPQAIAYDWVHDGYLDLKVLQIGQTIATDWGFAGVGAQVVWEAGELRIDLKPTKVYPRLGVCRWDALADKLGWLCPAQE